jgi:phosphatidylglycerol:prolipoprotein diacylglycerol transferase
MRPFVVDALNRWFGTELFSYLVPNYIVLLAVAVFCGTLVARRRARRRGLDTDAVYGLALWGLPAALAGGRLAHVIVSPSSYESVLQVLDPLRGDSLAFGGFIGAAAAMVSYLLLRRLDVWRYLDCIVCGVGLGNAITRLGCFLDGCDFGAVTASWLGVAFPRGSPAFEAQLQAGLLSPDAAASLPVHPVQLYLAAKGLVLAVLAAVWSGSARARPGEAFCAYWVAYAVLRIGIETLRGDEARGFVGPLSTSQVIAIPVFVISAAGLYLRHRARSDGG